MKLNSKGILIVGTYKVNNKNLAQKAGLKAGDEIVKINDNNVSNIEDMAKEINKSKTKQIKITYNRENNIYETTLKLYKEEDTYKTGLYVKDSVVGIGTLTYIDPETKTFGSLGHEISETSTGKIFEISSGTIFSSKVTGIIKSTEGSIGEKQVDYNDKNIIGTINENTVQGVFGKYNGNIKNYEKYTVAKPNQIKKGKAELITVLENNESKKYEINITKINNPDKSNKNFIFEIKDSELINKTNGIIQGMSGSPIVQNGYIIGAVTNVIVSNPIKGYGIFITSMLEESEN